MTLEINSEGFNFSSFDCETPDEVEVQIRQSAAKPFDEIWLIGEKQYPCLSLLISGKSVGW